ncbi:nucleoside deaminase [Nocardia seriolae]|uniref:tRNA(Adenine(34)) deaminase n=1 Tax=Nocardia seriolae TaxID=37332 RepID=A0A0B8NAI0_9NOCA|nr:nucleoside deaminase [Nocardia seriolae]APB00231.1 tRNA(adenine(34)) deaminase [Nocardia seriolae]MTJ64904.1 nucleoside deaminase [Nocardia seriolae]MTJ70930.1 nucleoside deaminase [Nocardia seriolae]MTJ89721.1 nucleoside deaminase [Nocardia seriolae]MTK33696.1 nucleoside deaminase [Nocardia seriolae]
MTTTPATAADTAHLRAAVAIAERARRKGNHPFGALLVGADGAMLLEAENTVTTARDATGHAETNLVRLATAAYEAEFLRGCTLYTSTEPCAMCAGAIYWGNIGRVVYALGEDELLAMTGANPDNPTMSLPCRVVFAAGQRVLPVLGPVELAEARAVHEGFWD